MRVFHKFNAQRSESDGIKFPSKKERDYYLYLRDQQKSGKLLFFLRSVPFDLPGGTRYFMDFVEFWEVDEPGSALIKFTEVKGKKLPLGMLKVAQTMEIYNIHIDVI